MQTNLNEGDVIQYAEFNIFGQPSQVNHTMYVTGRNSNNYYLTYHSESRLDKSLVEICNDLPNKYFIFYMNNVKYDKIYNKEKGDEIMRKKY